MSEQTTARKQPARQREGKRTITVTLGIPAFVTSIGVGLIALVWVFILGIIIGRGYKPEDSIPKLSRIMPQAVVESLVDAEPPRVISGTDQTITRENRTDTSNDTGNRMMSQEDLNFHNSVKSSSKPQPRTVRSAGESKKAEAAPINADPQKPTRPAAQTQTKLAPPAPPAKPQDPAATPEQEDKTVYNYVYQVAAYKKVAPADAFVAKLKKSSILARIQEHTESNTTWYRIMVDFKGTPEDTRKLRVAFEEHGISRIILRDKKPAR